MKVLEMLQDENVPSCRICSMAESKDNKLVAPCKCIGNLQYVHPNCILAWIYKTKNQMCPLCKYKIKVKRVGKQEMPCSFVGIVLFYLACIRQSTVERVYSILCRIAWAIGCILYYILAMSLLPLSRMFSLPVFRPFLSVSQFIKYKEVAKTHKKNTYTLLDTISKLSIFSDYNAIYSEVGHDMQNSTNIKKTPDDELKKIFSIIVFEEDLESGMQARHSTLDYFVFFISLLLVGGIAYLTNPVESIKGDVTVVYFLLPTAMALILIYILACATNEYFKASNSRGRWIGVSVIYCKLLIIVLLRYGILPYFIGYVVLGFISCTSTFSFINLKNVSTLARNGLILFMHGNESVHRCISKIFNETNIDRWIHGAQSILSFSMGNAFIIGLDIANRRTPWIVRPGISSWLFPMDIFLSRVVKDTILTNIIGYIVIFFIFCMGIVVYMPLCTLIEIVATVISDFFRVYRKTKLEILAWSYYYIPVLLFLYGGFAQTYFGWHVSLFKTVAVRLARMLKLSSLLFDGALPSGSVDLKYLHYLPSKNHMPYSRKEIQKRRDLVVTKSEKEMYFDENGNKKKITKERIFNREEEDKEWASFVMSSGRAELLYNPLYSVFYIPSFYVIRIAFFMLVLLALYLLLSFFSIFMISGLFLAVEDSRRKELEDQTSLLNILQSVKPMLSLLCIEILRLFVTYRDRKFVIVRKLVFSLRRYVLGLCLPFVSCAFSSASKKVFSDGNCTPFLFQNNGYTLVWALSYGVGMDILFRNSEYSVKMISKGSLILVLYKVIDEIVFHGNLADKSTPVKLSTGVVLFLLFHTHIIARIFHRIVYLPQTIEETMLFHETEMVLSDCE